MKTGLSDHHMIYAIFKPKFEKFEPKKSIYICNSMSPMRTHAAFEKKINPVLGKHAAKKTKIFKREPKILF